MSDQQGLGVVNSKKISLVNVFQQILPQKQLINQDYFFGLNLDLQGSLKVRGSEINFIK